MSQSVAEVTALVRTACRGLGLPLGHAEILAASVKFYRGDWLLFAKALENESEGASARCAIELIDAAICDGISDTRQVDVSELLSALVARSNAAGFPPLNLMQDGAGWRLERQEDVSADPVALPTRLNLPDEAWAMLQAQAARTYVPATEESRLGAGSLLSDND